MNKTTTKYHQVKRVWFILPFYLFTFLPLSAQTFTQRIQKKNDGQGTVTIHQSDSINQLVNSTVLGPTGKTPSPTTPTSPSSATSSANTTSTPSKTSLTTQTTTPGTQEEEVVQPTRTMKTIGYRIQVFAGGNSRADRQKAEQTRNAIKSHFPNMPVYVKFYSPRWICRAGNFRTYEEAHQVMTSLQSLGFNQCTIVKGKISVAY